MAEELYQLAATMDHMFHKGDGRLLLRAVAHRTGTTVKSGAMPGMTRQGGSLTSEPGNLVHNFRAYTAGMHMREIWRRANGTKTYSQETLVDTGRRLTDVPFVCFLLCFRDIMGRVVSPWAKIMQTERLEPWALAKKHERHTTALSGSMELLSGIREFARVLVLLCQHASSDERAALARAAFYASPHIFWKGASGSKWGRHFPALMLALPSLLCEDARPTYQGVFDEISHLGKEKIYMFIHFVAAFY